MSSAVERTELSYFSSFPFLSLWIYKLYIFDFIGSLQQEINQTHLSINLKPHLNITTEIQFLILSIDKTLHSYCFFKICYLFFKFRPNSSLQPLRGMCTQRLRVKNGQNYCCGKERYSVWKRKSLVLARKILLF